MRLLFILLLAISVVGCGNKQDETDKERKQKSDNRYKVPPPSDRKKDKGF